ncbi:hypothetical protein D6C87_09133 [Aureobasidium pullulans]|uniref:Uncharacterized protein n=1 Tax=Aureobasidium pullulans TaxID=5580 RepID=A0AB38LMN5_AURPU|nr:hypothetical protein D6C94_08575 [Aureobasidium pullulans]THZ36495.1 hypothetical protein D6C87_09133 [Aureobasidium pullulans]
MLLNLVKQLRVGPLALRLARRAVSMEHTKDTCVSQTFGLADLLQSPWCCLNAHRSFGKRNPSCHVSGASWWFVLSVVDVADQREDETTNPQITPRGHVVLASLHGAHPHFLSIAGQVNSSRNKDLGERQLLSARRALGKYDAKCRHAVADKGT